MDRPKVLLVDDDERLLRLCRYALENAGIDCDTAKDGVEGRNMAGKQVYRVVITDLAMPRLHGHGLVNQLIEDSYPAKYVVYTGVAEPKLIREMLRIGVSHVLMKPMDIGLFTGTIQGLLDRISLGPQRDATKNVDATIQRLEENRDHAEQRLLGFLRLMSKVTGKLEGNDANHASRVEHIALQIANELDFKKSDHPALQAASLVHEIGQFGLSAPLQTANPGKLTGKDLDTYKQYPEIGAMLLSEIDGADDVVATVDAHCEHYDGTGFPKGLVGEAIPLMARILRIADGIDTLKMTIPDGSDYLDSVRTHLQDNAGKIYDPHLAQVALTFLEDAAGSEAQDEKVEIEVSRLQPGMRKVQDLYSPNGQLLVRDGAIITAGMIRRLKQRMPGEKIMVESAD